MTVSIVKSIDEIEDKMARERLEELVKEPHVLGVMLWGSRATGFGLPTTDWDALIYVTEEYYDNLELKDTIWLEFDESVEPRRLVIDFSPVSDAWFRQQIESPLDMDHFPYVEGVVIYDPTGELEEWRQKLARYPEEEHLDRLKNKFCTLIGALYYTDINNRRGNIYDSKLNAFRAVVAAANLWFAMQKQWTPPLKWWTPHVKNMGMSEETYNLFCSVLDDPKFENVLELYRHLKKGLLDQGYEFVNDTTTTFLETIHVNGRPAQIKHTYI